MQGDTQRAKTRTADFPFAGRAELQRMRGLKDLCEVLGKKRCTRDEWEVVEWGVIPDAASPFKAQIPPPWYPPTSSTPQIPSQPPTPCQDSTPPSQPSTPSPDFKPSSQPPAPSSPDSRVPSESKDSSSPEPKMPSDPALQPKVEISSDRTVRYRCSVIDCGKLYSSKYRCGMHIIARHTGDTDRPFVCHIPGCSKAYATKDSLTRHRRVSGHAAPEEAGEKKEKPVEHGAESEGKYAESGEFRTRVQELVDLFDEF